MAISGNQWQSVAIRGNPWQSVEISGKQWQSVVISGNHLRVGRVGEFTTKHAAAVEAPETHLMREAIMGHQ